MGFRQQWFEGSEEANSFSSEVLRLPRSLRLQPQPLQTISSHTTPERTRAISYIFIRRRQRRRRRRRSFRGRARLLRIQLLPQSVQLCLQLLVALLQGFRATLVAACFVDAGVGPAICFAGAALRTAAVALKGGESVDLILSQEEEGRLSSKSLFTRKTADGRENAVQTSVTKTH